MKRFWLLLLPAFALAQSNYPRDLTITITWPTAYVDGSVILDGDLRGAQVICQRQDATMIANEEIPIVVLPGESQVHTFTGAVPQPGKYTCVAQAITVQNDISDPSNAHEQRFTGKPLPPTVN